jgi:hypothetical protein
VFKNLHFRLDPGQKGFKAQAVAAIAGDGSCTFENCLITLGEPRDCELAAVLLPRPNLVRTRMGSRGPTVRFQGCFVRGNGDLIRCRFSRPFKLEGENTLVALTGSLLSIDGGTLEEDGVEGKTDIDLRKVTAVVGGHILLLRSSSKDLKGILPLNCKPQQCLFVSRGRERALVHVVGGEADNKTALQTKVGWSAPMGNAYSFPLMLDQQLVGPGMMRPTPWKLEEWKNLTGETDGKFVDMIRFAGSPDSLDRAQPEQFVPVEPKELKDYGASVTDLRGAGGLAAPESK